MVQSPLISVVIPVYNTASTLKRCVESLTAQTYRHLEILLVNDGSTDQSGDICSRLAGTDPHIHVFTQENQGLSVARNTGVAHAHGEFVAFVDSDDYVSRSFIESLINEAKKDPQIDLVICGFMTNNPAFHQQEVPANRFITSGQDYLKQCLENPPIYDIVAWTKLYRTSLCRQAPFPPGRVHEDEFTYYRFIDKARLVATLPQALYHYVFNPKGITSTENTQEGLDRAEAYRQRLDFQVQHHFSRRSINRAARGTIVSILNTKYQHPEIPASSFFSYVDQHFGELLRQSFCLTKKHLFLSNKIFFTLLLHAPRLLYMIYASKHQLFSTLK